MQVIDLRTIAITLFVWAVTAVAAQSTIEKVVHCGANALAPENTWASADSALHDGAAWIGEDVRRSKAGELFILHDAALDCHKAALPMLNKAERKYTLQTDQLQVPADGKTLCTQKLQQAIDKINKKGGGRLILTKGTYLTGGLMLCSGVELYLEEGATLLGSTNPYDYKPIKEITTDDTRNDNASMALLMADGAEYISIMGNGTIDGQGLQLALNIDSLHHTGERVDPNYNQRRQRPSETARPKLLFFYGCKTVQVEGVSLRNSANWGLSLHLCEHVRLRHLDIENRAYWNNDGIDLTDCKHVLVADCKINAADDGICLKSYHADSECFDVEVARCDIRSSASAVKFGTASWGGFRKIYVHDIKVQDTFRSAIAIESVDGGMADSILVERIEAKNTGNAFFLRLGQRAGDRPGILRNVTIRQLKCEVPFGRPDIDYDLRGPEVDFFHNPFPASICGVPGHYIENVTLEDIEVSFPGRATKGMAYMPLWRIKDVPEQIQKYPEFSMFGELPAWALYLRHVKDLQLRNIRFSLRDTDYRPAFVFDDVKRFQLYEVEPQDESQMFINNSE